MPVRFSPWPLLFVLLSMSKLAAGADSISGKKLIEFGWDEPDTQFMRQHAREMEKTPFEGCVFHAHVRDAQGKQQQFLWDCWSKRAFSEADLKQSLEDLQHTEFHKFTSNFLRFNTAPGDVDWFDDYSAILSNCKLAAAFARDGKCTGILFDTEQYNQPLFDYRKQRDAKTKSWDEYAARARNRGREVMQAFQEGYPDLTIFLTFGYSLPFVEAGDNPAKISQAHYGLLAPFLDGMVDEARGKTRIVDGCELSYSYKDTSKFEKMYQTMSTGVLPIVADRKKYHQVFSVGFGVWMDDNWRKKGWDIQDPQKNFYTPQDFQNTVRAALERSDEYVWVYTEKPRWWSEQGGPVDLPPAYERALRRAAGR